MIFKTYYAYLQEGIIENLLISNRLSYYFIRRVASNLLK